MGTQYGCLDSDVIIACVQCFAPYTLIWIPHHLTQALEPTPPIPSDDLQFTYWYLSPEPFLYSISESF